MYNGSGLIVLVSALAGATGLFIMVGERRWKAVIGILVGYAIYAFIGSLIFDISDNHTRLLLAIPFALTIPIVLMSGIFIWDAATDAEAFSKRWNTYTKRKIDLAKRRKGTWQILISCVFWLYWGLHPNLSGAEAAVVACLWLYPMILGFFNFFAKQED